MIERLSDETIKQIADDICLEDEIPIKLYNNIIYAMRKARDYYDAEIDAQEHSKTEIAKSIYNRLYLWLSHSQWSDFAFGIIEDELQSTHIDARDKTMEELWELYEKCNKNQQVIDWYIENNGNPERWEGDEFAMYVSFFLSTGGTIKE